MVMRLVVILFVCLLLWRIQPNRMILAGLLGGLLWAVVESTYLYHTMTDMKRLVSPFKVASTLQTSAVRSVSTFMSRAIVFYSINHLLTVSKVPLWSHLFGMSFGFYAVTAMLWAYHTNRVLVSRLV